MKAFLRSLTPPLLYEAAHRAKALLSGAQADTVHATNDENVQLSNEFAELVALRKRALFTHDSSAAGETAHLAELFDRFNIGGGTIVDVAAADGVYNSNTLPFLRNASWRGLAVELQGSLFSKLAFAYRDFKNTDLAKCRITPTTIVPLLRAHDILQDFELLSLDIDSYDLAVAHSVLSAGYRPKVLLMEINEKIPPPVFFAVHYRPDHSYNGDHFYGCSITAACEVIKAHGYLLESLQYNNAFFVRSDVADNRISDQDCVSAYHAGYAERPDRAARFPWNADMDDLLTMPANDIVDLVAARFQSYAPHFDLRI
jgi:hypothetical protein